MTTSAPLLYSEYIRSQPAGPIRRIELLPIRTLIRFTAVKIKSEFRINSYIVVYILIFGAMLISGLTLLQFN